MIKLSRLDVEIIFLVARYKKGYIGEVWHMTGPKSPSTWWSAQREIPRLLDVHAAADQRVCSPLNKTAFLRSATLLIEEISFYFIYGHNVRGGFLPSLPLRHFYWPSRISIIYFKPRFARIPIRRNFGNFRSCSPWNSIQMKREGAFILICKSAILNSKLSSFIFGGAGSKKYKSRETWKLLFRHGRA